MVAISTKSAILRFNLLKYSLEHIARIVGSTSKPTEGSIEYLVLDSRKIYAPANSLFFALKGPRRDGHLFIREVYKKGVRNFVVSKTPDTSAFPSANFIEVKDTLKALQDLAAYHRQQFNVPVIGITGSNGKTIVKEWLYQLLHPDYNIVRSPRSYNSQIGVPLSVWQMNEKHNLAIFEAGISQPGEMEKLENVIRPTIGVLTNIGEAHNEGFVSMEQKEAEKRILFRNAKEPDKLEVIDVKKLKSGSLIYAKAPGDKSTFTIEIPFNDDASVQNAVTCWQVMRMLGSSNETIKARMKLLLPVNMRLELKKGINHCSIINDSYSADLSSLEIALNFLNQQNPAISRTVILSDFLQSGMQDEELYSSVFDSVRKYNVNRLIGIGEKIKTALSPLKIHSDSIKVEMYDSTDSFIKQFRSSQFREETILIKGARIFGFERIVQLFEQKAHQTILEINLNAIAHNLKVYQDQLSANTKIMAMVKAFAYGSGGAEIAGILQFHKVDYLGVAYADEGVDLRKAGITLPIMVMNPEETAFESLIEYNLEPDIYSFEMLYAFDRFLQNEGLQQYPVHVEIETGMNRLGFNPGDIANLSDYLQKTAALRVQTVFTHLAASEDPKEDDFTIQQFDRFKMVTAELKQKLGYSFLEHIANSAAIFRLPNLQLDMVRLGIGLYGVDSADTYQVQLQPVATFKSTIAQLKKVKAGETISYNRRGVVKKDSVIATIRVGYADGFPRRLGNGAGQMWVNGALVPVIGTVCMDMTMVDVTGIENIREGDEVIIFGKELPIQQLAQWAKTIPYEIMTGISQRVERVYFEE